MSSPTPPSGTSGPPATWRPFVAAAVAALAVVVTADAALQRVIVYPAPLREVDDAVAELDHGDPTVLVIGSSHARSFDSIGAELGRRSGGRERVLAVPVEYGKLASYLWVFEHRLAPLIDERLPDGALRRPSLRRAILVTEWWDSCEATEGPVAYNLPARAWTLGDFFGDVARNGLTDFNRNYVANRWTRLWHRSVLVRDRGHGLLMSRIRDVVRPLDSATAAGVLEAQISGWQRLVEGGNACLGAAPQMQALDSLTATLSRRGLEVALLLYPRKPATLTARAKETTLARFTALAGAHARRHDLRFVDLTDASPLTDDHFAADFDHVTPTGNRMLAVWALDGPLSWLADSTALAVAPASGIRQ